MDAHTTHQNLLDRLRDHRVLSCTVRAGKVFFVFDDGEVEAPGFVIGQRCEPFAQFVVESGLEQNFEAVRDYLAALPRHLEGEIFFPGFGDVEWPPPE